MSNILINFYYIINLCQNISICSKMLPFYHSKCDNTKKIVVLSEINDEEALEKASETYDGVAKSRTNLSGIIKI